MKQEKSTVPSKLHSQFFRNQILGRFLKLKNISKARNQKKFSARSDIDKNNFYLKNNKEFKVRNLMNAN